MNLETLRSQREAILHIAAKHGTSNLHVLGSVARQESTPDSDIDLLAELEPQRTLLDQIALIQDDLKVNLNRIWGITEQDLPNLRQPVEPILPSATDSNRTSS